jgi:hypothetical protein
MQIAAHQGLWERALVYSQAWKPVSSHCGFASYWEERWFADFQLRCMFHLQRYDEVVASLRDDLNQTHASRGLFTAGNVELWIECELARGRAQNAEQATALIVVQVCDARAPVCLDGKRLFDLSHQPRDVQATRLALLADEKPEQALALLLEGGATRVLANLHALDLVQGKLRDARLAWLLVQTGDQSIAPRFESDKPPPDSLREDWLVAQARRRALTTAR